MASPDSHPDSADDVPISLGNNIFLYPATQRGNHACRHAQQQRLGAEAELETGTGAAGPTAAPGPSSPTSPPALIVLCTWLGGATTRRINHYVAGYRRHYPCAEILLIRTVFLDISVRSFATLRARLEPALGAIRQVLYDQSRPEDEGPNNNNNPTSPAAAAAAEQDSPGGGGSGRRRDVLLHVFSHGGCNTALQLTAAMPPPERARFHARLRLVVFDCCPGDASFRRAYEAALLSLPPTGIPLRWLGAAGVYGVVGMVHALQASGLMRSVRDLRRGLNDPQQFVGRGAGRLYLFSDGDRAVAAGDVVSHAREAEGAGYTTEVVRFGGAGHCALIVEDASRYWDAICGRWDRLGSVGGCERVSGAVDLLPRPKL